jgi:hypothetical protein
MNNRLIKSLILLLGGVGSIVAGNWYDGWFDPNYTPPRTNTPRPCLSRRDCNRSSEAPAPVAAVQSTEGQDATGSMQEVRSSDSPSDQQQ